MSLRYLELSFEDQLECLHDAYEALEVISGTSEAEVHHVASVLRVLNYQFQDLCERQRKATRRPSPASLSVVSTECQLRSAE